ncbi:glutamate synthase [Clostridium sp. WILCCON 0269]|uniref:Glutamate synthase n=1 Tax=Candidatus Clostridium eludens TaxID=3381663 RepID=A0ABW8SP62_9CLOT
MEYIDALNFKSEELNKLIIEKLQKNEEVSIENPHSMHNIAIGLKQKGKIIVNGSTGFYTGGFLEGSKIVVEGNTGWYTGDNMMDGELIVTKNTGCNAGVYFYGGTMVIYGGTGSRVGYGMKGGTIIVCGSSGRWAGQMTFGGKLILLGSVGKQVGESMYKGVIYTQDNEVEGKLGGNVHVDSIKESEIRELKELFNKYGIKANPQDFNAIRPSSTGRHTYVLFKPELKPELAKKHV